MFHCIRSASRLAIGLAMFVVAFFLVCASPGCQTVGPSNRFDRKTATLDNPSPVTLDIADDDKRGTASGVGPAGWTTIKPDVIERFQSGATQRDLFLTVKPDGTRQLNLSSGTDFGGEGFHYESGDVKVDVAKFNTSASSPLGMTTEQLKVWAAVSTNYTAENAELLKHEYDQVHETIKDLAPTMDNLIQALIKAGTGGAVP